MKIILTSISILLLFTISSCKKETDVLFNNEIIGDWVWKSSEASNGTKIFPNDSSVSYHILFKTDKSFLNTASCIIGGQQEGIYDIVGSGNDKKVVLMSQNYKPDSFKILMANNYLVLIEYFDNYSWSHAFYKK